MNLLRRYATVLGRFLGIGRTARHERDLADELGFHLGMQVEDNLRRGMTPHEARRQAVLLFGGIEGHKEASRDVRRGSRMEQAVRDIRYAWRSYRRAPVVSLTIVATVGLGLGLVAAAFTILNAQIFRTDAVRDPHSLFAVERLLPRDAAPATFTRAEYEALVRETAVFAGAFVSRHGEAQVEGRRMEGPLVSGNFFQVLGVSAAFGRTLTPQDDEPGSPPVLVLSHRTWLRHFAGDPEVLTRPIRVNGASFRVVGVMPEEFRGLAFMAPEFWAPLSALRTSGNPDDVFPALDPDAGDLRIVGRLKPGLTREQAVTALRAWDAGRAPGRLRGPPTERLTLEPRTGTVALSAEMVLMLTPLFFAFGLILMIGCMNVANLLFARGVARQREIGIRLAIGASRHRVIRQLLTEGLLLALVAAALAFGVARLVLVTVVYTLTSSFPPGIGHLRIEVPPSDWRVALFLVAGAVVSTLCFALAPALRATRMEPLPALRGDAVSGGRPGRARDALVALQVSGAALLLICAAVFLRSAWAATTVDPGIRTTSIVNVRVLDESRRENILAIVNGESMVASVAASTPGRLGGFPAVADGVNGKVSLTHQFVSPEYFGILGIPLVRGRGFTPSERSAGAAVAVVSERAAQELWPGMEAVGQVLRLEASPPAGGEAGELQGRSLPAHTADVIGVARDVAGFRVFGMRMGGAGVYLPTSAEAAGTTLAIQVRGDAEPARRVLVERLAAIDPNMTELSTMETIARAEAYLLSIPFWLTLVLGAMALLLTLSGLFSVLSYLVEQRTKEIGVRIALGATRRGIAALVLSQSARPVGIGLLLGGGCTAALGAVLLATPAAEQIGSSVRLFDPVAYAAGLLAIVAACAAAALVPAVRAAWIDPVGALRQE